MEIIVSLNFLKFKRGKIVMKVYTILKKGSELKATRNDYNWWALLFGGWSVIFGERTKIERLTGVVLVLLSYVSLEMVSNGIGNPAAAGDILPGVLINIFAFVVAFAYRKLTFNYDLKHGYTVVKSFIPAPNSNTAIQQYLQEQKRRHRPNKWELLMADDNEQPVSQPA